MYKGHLVPQNQNGAREMNSKMVMVVFGQSLKSSGEGAFCMKVALRMCRAKHEKSHPSYFSIAVA